MADYRESLLYFSEAGGGKRKARDPVLAFFAAAEAAVHSANAAGYFTQAQIRRHVLA